MRRMSLKLREGLAADPFYHHCARATDGGCDGRITFEHALIYAGKQINERFAIIPLCAYHHAVDWYQDCGDLYKAKNEWIAISRMTTADKEKYSRFNWDMRLRYLELIFGIYLPPALIGGVDIQYPEAIYHKIHD